MSSPRQDICWIEDSIRPYESLWSVLNRFFALNVINSAAFAKEFFTHGWFSSISTSVLGNPPSFSHEKFYAALGLTPKEYSPLDLSYLKNALLAVEKTSLKYCPVCINFYYHSIFFQLSWMKVCPVHSVELINICPHCGHFLDDRITASITKKPYSCTNCETELLKVNRKAALFPPNLEGSEKLKEVNEWCNFILNIPNNYAVIGMVKNGIPTNWFYPIYNTLATKPIPNCFEVLSPYIDSLRINYKCGVCENISKSAASSLLQNVLSGRDHIPNLAPIFKSYRRYLIKREVGNWGKIKLAHGHEKWIGEVDVSERYIKLYAILTFTDTLKRWGQNVQDQDTKRYLYMSFNFYDIFNALKFCKNSQEAEWIIHHAYFEELRGLYQETLKASKRSIEENSFWKYWPLTGVHLPCLLTTREQKGNNLILSSFQNAYYLETLSANPYDYVLQTEYPKTH
jgi:hypothetical protein